MGLADFVWKQGTFYEKRLFLFVMIAKISADGFSMNKRLKSYES